ncbi:phosphodiester glycosidase family protein (plasmid) [Bacillus carboniphilus]|uniref:Phosphodiester glycosidase family protein n=1 Tax=Bacillus carboniphilus TaxID=86663 RepID=A0ABY9K176_9BACI|nr:phosphodiester glycosidase family protein [Bacillus carboniphilus]WLR44445.1 phosphodiester glycosidase family protein [Bacillus carboniphilus]
MLKKVKKVTQLALVSATVFAASIVGGNVETVQAAKTVHKANSYEYIETNDFRVIKTHASNIKALKIDTPLINTRYFGINGGLFNFPEEENGYKSSASNIFWEKSQVGKPYTLNERNTGNNYRGTLVTFKDPIEGTKAVIKSYRNTSEVKADLGANLDYRNMLGGGNLYLKNPQSVFDAGFNAEGWDSRYHHPRYTGATRTGIGLKYENGKSYLYLMVSKYDTSLYNLRNTMINLGCNEGIWLDGGISSQMRVNNGSGIFEFAQKYEGQYRSIHHAVTLINTH